MNLFCLPAHLIDMSKPLRYYVDERVGAIAVRDRYLDNPDDKGLWRESQGVIAFWAGRYIPDRCPTCNQPHGGHWSISDEDIASAKLLCETLNKINPTAFIWEKKRNESVQTEK
jgi:hypothetical protein